MTEISHEMKTFSFIIIMLLLTYVIVKVVVVVLWMNYYFGCLNDLLMTVLLAV